MASRTKLRSVSLSTEQRLKIKSTGAKPRGGRGIWDEAIPEIDKDFESQFSLIRQNWAYKRRELAVEPDEPTVRVLRTPDFAYRVSLHADPADEGEIFLRREILDLKTPNLLFQPAFETTFADSFGRAIFEFENPIPITDIVDKVEEAGDESISLNYDSQCSYCELRIKSFSGNLRFEGKTLTIESPGTLLSSTVLGVLRDLEDCWSAGFTECLALPQPL